MSKLSPRLRFVAGGVVGLLVVVAALAIWQGTRSTPIPEDAQLVQEVLRGVPQSGEWIGRADAPVALQVWVDPLCSDCQQLMAYGMPQLIRRWVATGKARFRLRVWPADGGASIPAAQMLQATAASSRLWGTAMLASGRAGKEAGDVRTAARDLGSDSAQLDVSAGSGAVRLELARTHQDARRRDSPGAPFGEISAVGCDTLIVPYGTDATGFAIALESIAACAAS